MYVCFMAASEEGKSEQLHHMSGSLEEGVGEWKMSQQIAILQSRLLSWSLLHFSLQKGALY